MTTTVQKWGNSQGIRIPKVLLDELNWSDNEQLILNTDKDKLVIERARPHKNIKELFADFDDDYKTIDINWGKPAGKEIW